MVGPESAGAHPGPACYRKGNAGQFVPSSMITVYSIVVTVVHSLLGSQICSSLTLKLISVDLEQHE